MAQIGARVREVDGRRRSGELSTEQSILPPVSRAGNRTIYAGHSSESAELFSFVRFADSSAGWRLAWLLGILFSFSVTATISCRRIGEGRPAEKRTRQIIDEADRRVIIPEKIDRIVSLAPNLTEIVYAVGAGDRLVGDTTYCDYPEAAKNVTKVGDTMHPSIERIIALKPQIVLVSTASQLEAFTKQLDEQHIAAYVTNPQSLADVFNCIATLGALFGDPQPASQISNEMRRRVAGVQDALHGVKPVRVFYQVADQPLYTIGRDAYLTDLIRRAGGVSVTENVPGAFMRYSDEAALASKPDAIILPTGGSMGNANSSVAAALRNSPAVLNNRVHKINDDYLSRPGPRLVDGLEEMAKALHPERKLFK